MTKTRSNNAFVYVERPSQIILLMLFGRKFQQQGRRGTCITYIAESSPATRCLNARRVQKFHRKRATAKKLE